MHAAPRRATDRAWVEVDLSALARNARVMAEHVGGPGRLLPMVKADAYGLGAVPIAELLQELGVWALGVATVEEGARLRRAGIHGRIVVFTPCAPIDARRLRAEGLQPAVTSLAALETYAAAGSSAEALAIHLEVDTGMGRFGLPAAEAGRWAPRIATALGSGAVRLVSTFTHFHSAETDRAATREQWERFLGAVEAMRSAGVEPGLLHAANSGGVIRHPETHADVVRPGLFLFGGMAAGGERDGDGVSRPESVVSVRARVLDVRAVGAGTTVSYGGTYTTSRPSRLATLGIGYADGMPHALSNAGHALLHGRRAPILGAVCMDMTVVDVTELEEVPVGTVATLLGRDAGEEIRLGEVARQSRTIPYEILTGFSSRLPRVLLSGPDGGRTKPGRVEAMGGGAPVQAGEPRGT
ncbi:MAG: alanine racemase [Gemmatimonadota bacterium]